MKRDTTLFENNPSDMKIQRFTERELKDELFSKKSTAEHIKALEKKMGYPQAKQEDTVKKKTAYVLLEPETNDEQLPNDDGAFLNKLLNDPKYRIIMYKDNFTVQGAYIVAIIYEELLDTPTKELGKITSNI